MSVKPYLSQTTIGRSIVLQQGEGGVRLKLKAAVVWALPGGKEDYHIKFARQLTAQRGESIDMLKRWGVNCIVLRFDALDYLNKRWASLGVTQAEYLQAMQDWINDATAAGLYVGLRGWDMRYMGKAWPKQYATCLPFLQEMLQLIGNNERVFHIPWGVPQVSGVYIGSSEWIAWQTVMSHTCGFYRDNGYRGLLIISLPGCRGYDDQQMRMLETLDATLPGMDAHQVGFAVHVPTGPWSSQVWQQISGYNQTHHGLFVAEFAHLNPDGGWCDPTRTREVCTFLGSAAFGQSNYMGAAGLQYGAWSPNTPHTNGMVREDGSLSEFGEIFVAQFCANPE